MDAILENTISENKIFLSGCRGNTARCVGTALPGRCDPTTVSMGVVQQLLYPGISNQVQGNGYDVGLET
jgi:hypothetical protein